jgi:CubicO group peptidase (beta-lactamase class C family)
MRLRWLRIPAMMLAVLLAWAVFVPFAVLHDWWQSPIAPRGDVHAFAASSRDIVDGRLTGNLAMIVLDGGHPVADYYASIDPEEAVGGDTLFQAASLSKWVTAWGVMSLVDRDIVDLDAPVETYLTRWRLPASEFDHDGVTVRRLLSHTAGLVDGLGYGGFVDPGAVQGIEESLARAADADPGRNGIVRVGREPGTGWRYSGGGYLILQLLIEEVSLRPFAEYMRAEVLEPLGMARSSYLLDQAMDDGLAAHFTDGVRVPHRYFTAQAAAGLHTTAADMARFLAAHSDGPGGESRGRGVVSGRSLDQMVTPHGSQFGIGIWGLGPIIYGPVLGRPRVVGHDGHNAPGIGSTARLDLAGGSGIIVLSSGDPHIASDLGAAWVYHHLGTIDILALNARLGRMVILVGVGAVVILVFGTAGALLDRRRRRPTTAQRRSKSE